jgi:hypothetical protein
VVDRLCKKNWDTNNINSLLASYCYREFVKSFNPRREGVEIHFTSDAKRESRVESMGEHRVIPLEHGGKCIKLEQKWSDLTRMFHPESSEIIFCFSDRIPRAKALQNSMMNRENFPCQGSSCEPLVFGNNQAALPQGNDKMN